MIQLRYITYMLTPNRLRFLGPRALLLGTLMGAIVPFKVVFTIEFTPTFTVGKLKVQNQGLAYYTDCNLTSGSGTEVGVSAQDIALCGR